jgi:hypothetical protein
MRMDELESRTSALFGRLHTLVIADGIRRLPGSFTRQQVFDITGLSPKAASAVDREFAALITAKVLVRESRGRYTRVEGPFWELASALLEQWSAQPADRPVAHKGLVRFPATN